MSTDMYGNVNGIVIERLENYLDFEFKSDIEIARQIIRDNLKEYLESKDVEKFVNEKRIFSLTTIRQGLEHLANNNYIQRDEYNQNQYKLFEKQTNELDEISYL